MGHGFHLNHALKRERTPQHLSANTTIHQRRGFLQRKLHGFSLWVPRDSKGAAGPPVLAFFYPPPRHRGSRQ